MARRSPVGAEMTVEQVVLDASALIDLLRERGAGQAVRGRIDGRTLHAPAHLDAEILSGLGRLHRAAELSAETVAAQLAAVAAAPITRHSVGDLFKYVFDKGPCRPSPVTRPI
jgi:predicted nucleic acid-binding protein